MLASRQFTTLNRESGVEYSVHRGQDRLSVQSGVSNGLSNNSSVLGPRDPPTVSTDTTESATRHNI